MAAVNGKVTVTVPALSSLVLKADKPLPAPTAGPAVTLKAPAAGATGTVELTADVTGGGLNRVVFAAQTGNGRWQTLGTADHAPYKVTQHVTAPSRHRPALQGRRRRQHRPHRERHRHHHRRTGPRTREAGRRRAHPRRRPLQARGRELRRLDPEGRRPEAAFTGRDAHGAFAWVKVPEGASSVPYTVEKNGTADGPQRSVNLGRTGEVWITQGQDGQSDTAPATPPQDKTKAVLHYQRADGNYDGWGLHTWTGAAQPTDWSKPLMPVRFDAYGAVYEVPLTEGASSLSYILHKGDEKDLPTDQSLDLAGLGHEVWMLGGQPKYLLPTMRRHPGLDLGKAEAQWIDRDTVVWKIKANDSTSQQLVHAEDGGITVTDGALNTEGQWLRLNRTELTDAQRTKYPHLAEYPAFTVDPRDTDRVRDSLRGQLIATQRAANGALLAATGVQTMRRPRRPVREEGDRRRTRPRLPRRQGHPLRVGPHGPGRRPRTRRPDRAHAP